MKIITLVVFLAAVEFSRGGQIADLFWRQHETNDLASSGAFSPPKPPPATHGISEIGIERTPCFGSCPVYVCIIRGDGSVRYHGEAGVERIGNWEANIDPYRFRILANFIAESGYAEMQDNFASNVTDGDTVYTTFVIQGHRKVFRNYASSGPQSSGHCSNSSTGYWPVQNGTNPPHPRRSRRTSRVERMGCSRFTQRPIERQRRVPPIAHPDC